MSSLGQDGSGADGDGGNAEEGACGEEVDAHDAAAGARRGAAGVSVHRAGDRIKIKASNVKGQCELTRSLQFMNLVPRKLICDGQASDQLD